MCVLGHCKTSIVPSQQNDTTGGNYIYQQRVIYKMTFYHVSMVKILICMTSNNANTMGTPLFDV